MKNVFIVNALKNPDVENDSIRFDAHLDQLFASVG